MEHYLTTDVLLLVDIFEEFSGVCIRIYGQDPADDVSSPRLSWDPMLRHSNCTLDLISEPDMFSMFEVRIPGEVSMISTRHPQANNSYMAGFAAAQPTSDKLDSKNLSG